MVALLAASVSCSDAEPARDGRSAVGTDGLVAAEWTLPNSSAPLSWELALVFEDEVSPTVRLEAHDHTVVLPFRAADRVHALPILGVAPGRRYVATLEGAGEAWDLGVLSTPPLPDRFPVIELVHGSPSGMAPGVTLTDLKVPSSSVAYLAAFDSVGRVVWLWDVPDDWGDTRAIGDYRLLGLSRTDATIANLFGEIQERWTESPESEVDRAVDWKAMHHEVLPLSDGGLLTLSEQVTAVEHYPTTYTSPELFLEAATLDDPVIVELAADGTTRRALALSEFMDTRRIGFDSLDRLGGGRLDWAHANGVTLAPDGDWVVSVRHQDAVVKVSPAGEIRWILGNHMGWREAWRPFLLEPLGALEWPWHQHAPEVLEDGTIVMLDNGRWRASPYEGPEPESHVTYSRAVAYRVDEGTVEQLWEVAPAGLYSAALGDADVQPETGTVLLHLGFLDADETGTLHEELGWGRKAMRLIEVHPERPDEPVWDLRLRSDAAAEPEGWKGYRGERLPSLYPPGVLVDED